MARGRCTFKQLDVKRALLATVAAGLTVRRIEIDTDGKIVILPGKPDDVAPESSGGNEWDQN